MSTHRPEEVLPESEKCLEYTSLFAAEKEDIIAMSLRAIGIPGRYADVWELPKRPFNFLTESKNKAALLSGDTGTGKTTALAFLTARLVDENSKKISSPAYMLPSYFGQKGIYLPWDVLVKLVQESVIRDEEPDKLVRFDGLGDYSLLILDDLFTTMPTEFVMGRICALINSRWIHGSRTLIATNHSAEALSKWTNFKTAYSRLADKDWCKYFELGGKDKRRT